MCFYNDGSLMEEETKDALLEMIPDSFFARGRYEILSEEETEIDIDSIEEVKHIYIYNLPPNVESVDDRVTMNEEKINELIKAVKQLNKINKKGE